MTPGDAVVFPSPSGRLRDPHNTVATRFDEAGLSARQIADHLGHTRPSLTQDVYTGRGLASPEAAAALDRRR